MSEAYSPLGKARKMKGFTTAKLSDIKPMVGRTKVGLRRRARLGTGKPSKGLSKDIGWKNPLL